MYIKETRVVTHEFYAVVIKYNLQSLCASFILEIIWTTYFQIAHAEILHNCLYYVKAKHAR